MKDQNMELFQLCYISTIDLKDLRFIARFKRAMQRSRQFFYEKNIHGITYYANEHFLHCIEGDKQDIDLIYQHILSHSDQNYRFCFLHQIQNFNFHMWQMKYVDKKGLVQLYCHKNGLEQFVPMNLTDTQIKELLCLICSENMMYA